MAKPKADRASVSDAADRLLAAHGSVSKVLLADVLTMVAGRKLNVGRLLTGWRAERRALATGMPESARRMAQEFAEDIWILSRITLDPASAAAAAPPAAPRSTRRPEPEPDGGPRRSRPESKVQTAPARATPLPSARNRGVPVRRTEVAHASPDMPGFLEAIEDEADAAPARSRAARPASAGKRIRVAKKKPAAAGAVKQAKPLPERPTFDRETRRVRVLRRLEQLSAELDPPALAAATKPVRKSDWEKAANPLVAEKAAHLLRQTGYPLGPKEICDELGKSMSWRPKRPYRDLPPLLEGSRIVRAETGQAGLYWFAGEDPPPRPTQPDYMARDTLEALVVQLGKLVYRKAKQILERAPGPMDVAEIEGALGEDILLFKKNWLNQRLKRDAADPEEPVVKAPEGYGWGKRRK
ncbi:MULTISPECIES: hypothetical protein [unclassified Bradyrhizobium]|uniref:hypothetical protein n=1 Tax=unclassified Bradyrhizobium TaxID=2631580 RepID=UPI002FF0C1EB